MLAAVGGLLSLASLGPAATRPSAAAKPPAATEVLAPRYFPTWQARNVAFPFVVLDPRSGRYRMYYAGSGAAQLNESAWDQWMTGVATSTDLRRWSFPEDYEPVLPARLFFDGEVVEPPPAARFDAMGAFGVSVIREGALWRMWYTGWSGEYGRDEPGREIPAGFRIGHAVSRDGLRWTRPPGRAGAGAVLALGAAGEPDSAAAGQPLVIRRGPADYLMWYEAYDGQRWRIAWARSGDGLAWEKQGVALEPGPPGAADELGLRNPVVIRRKGRWELWYQGRSRSRPAFHVLRALSGDLRTWSKVEEPVALHPTPPLRGGEAIAVDSVLVQPDGSCRAFFAKQVPTVRKGAWGEGQALSFHIFMERVDP